MSEEEVLDWWKSLETVGSFFFDGPKNLPGKVYEVYFDPLNRDGKVFCLFRKGSGRDIFQTSEFIDLPDEAWYMHMHTDNDSVLIINGETIRHAGYVTDEEYRSEEYEQPPEAGAVWKDALADQMKELIDQPLKEGE